MAEWAGDIGKKIKELEEENERLAIRLSKSAKHLLRLRLEKKFLLEKLDEIHPLTNNPHTDAKATSSTDGH